MVGEIRIPCWLPRDIENRTGHWSGMLSMGGKNVVKREPNIAEPECVLVFAIDRIVRMEPVGDCASARLGTVMEQSRTSLNIS